MSSHNLHPEARMWLPRGPSGSSNSRMINLSACSPGLKSVYPGREAAILLFVNKTFNCVREIEQGLPMLSNECGVTETAEDEDSGSSWRAQTSVQEAYVPSPPTSDGVPKAEPDPDGDIDDEADGVSWLDDPPNPEIKPSDDFNVEVEGGINLECDELKDLLRPNKRASNDAAAEKATQQLPTVPQDDGENWEFNWDINR
ncbi:hypothetical protein BD410DRAFT_829237 [Rickenella mellea]|uniref:Uncharacterized protein n=1 Tax=Rickenella mellea TaxID=50990 RepID=A0A4Y7Q297_9AGAM|nr:hypothetical protein BD410DRAFT_829237 [Rickenella mellea]